MSSGLTTVGLLAHLPFTILSRARLTLYSGALVSLDLGNSLLVPTNHAEIGASGLQKHPLVPCRYQGRRVGRAKGAGQHLTQSQRQKAGAKHLHLPSAGSGAGAVAHLLVKNTLRLTQ